MLAVLLLALTLGACGTIPENDPLRPAAAATGGRGLARGE